MNTATRGPVKGTAAPGSAWEVTLPDGTVHGDLTEHEAVMLTLHQGGGMQRQAVASK